MAEPQASESVAQLERALSELGERLEFPPTPPLAGAVTARLVAERPLRARPPLPQLAVWPRRRRLIALAALGLLLLAGAAAAARLGLGAIEIRVLHQLPTPTPTAVETGLALGRRISLGEAQAAVSFHVLAPSGPGRPDAVYLDRSPFGGERVVLAWRSRPFIPGIPGTPWGLILMEFRAEGGAALATKEIGVDLARVSRATVGGTEAIWITGPHTLVLRSSTGQREFLVNGNVLAWNRGGVTLRLESTLPKAEAIALAASVR